MPIKTQGVPDSLRSRIPTPQQEKGPPDLKRKKSNTERLFGQLDESFIYVFGLPIPKLSEGETLIFVLPLSPLSMNSSVHWRTKDAVVNRFEACFDALQSKWALPKVPRSPWPRVLASYTFHVTRKNDISNLMGRAKIAEDCIVRGRWVRDDSPSHWQWESVPRQIVSASTPAHLIIRLREPVGDEWEKFNQLEVKP
ncbi:hypothetical protein IAD21_00590 [Abditibacteriota bacterium]|nr:hypothetical protein IAD21_00590 [Abditibacteriota bacterium]